MRKLVVLLALATLFFKLKRQACVLALSCWDRRGFNRHVENCAFDQRCFL